VPFRSSILSFLVQDHFFDNLPSRPVSKAAALNPEAAVQVGCVTDRCHKNQDTAFFKLKICVYRVYYPSDQSDFREMPGDANVCISETPQEASSPIVLL